MLNLRIFMCLVLVVPSLQTEEGCTQCTIKRLAKKINSYQAQKDTKYHPPIFWSKTKGIYESQVKVYFHGSAPEDFLRDVFSIYDVNMFATSWINTVLMEAYKYGRAPKPDPSQLELSLEAIATFTDKNANYTSSVMMFWPQQYNETLRIWQCTPGNLVSLIHLTDNIPLETLIKILKRMGLKKVEALIEFFLQMNLQTGEGCTQCTIKRLAKKINSYQAQKDTKYYPPNFWSKTKGIYESQVKLYFHGSASQGHLRDVFSIYDVNMFATSWVNTVLMEAYKYGQAPKPDPSQLELSLEAIATFTDKNANYTSSVMTFWPQQYNETLRIWQCTPGNLDALFHLTDGIPMETLIKILKRMGLKNVEALIEFFLQMKSMMKVFEIPPDFDDTFVNLGLGAMLTEMQTEFPKHQSIWHINNRNISSIFDALKKYAYRPFSKDRAVNTIDPRSYFYLRFFLENAKKNNRDIALAPTWVQNIDEARHLNKKGVVMPFNINNVGCTVSANVIYGITSGILSGLLNPDILDDPELEKIYRNTSRLVTWQLQTDLTKRPDLALLYYPSVIEFYWFVARSSSLLERHARSGKLPHQALEDTRVMLGKVLRGHVTTRILSMATRTDSEVYYDDFMGDDDRTIFNKKINKAEDRLFTTAMAANALQRIWTMYNETTKHNNWIHKTPNLVRDTVSKTVNYLQKNIFSFRFKPWNAFYSGSHKGKTTFPFSYPVNRKVSYKKGSYFLYGMENVVSEEEYLKMAKEPHFGNMTTPMEFHGFNNDTTSFPYWNSPPYTYATTLLALSQYENTQTVDERFQPRLRETIH